MQKVKITLVFVYPRITARREQSYEIANITEFREAVCMFCKDILPASGLDKIVYSKIGIAKLLGNQTDELLYLKNKLPFDLSKPADYRVIPYLIM